LFFKIIFNINKDYYHKALFLLMFNNDFLSFTLIHIVLHKSIHLLLLASYQIGA